MSEQPSEPTPETTPAPTPDAPPITEASEVDKDARLYGMLCHLLALLGLVGIPFGNILGPLVIWLIKKDTDPFVDDQGKESINFQITMTIAAIVLGLVTCFLAGLGALIVIIFDLVMVIIATLKANEGVRYRYPVTLRLIK